MSKAALDLDVGIDYSGGATTTSSVKELRVYLADGVSPPVRVGPPCSPRKYWTTRGITEWVAERLSADKPALLAVVCDFSFPRRFLETHRFAYGCVGFLDAFQDHRLTCGGDIYVEFVREGMIGSGAVGSGSPRWRRLMEIEATGSISGPLTLGHFGRPVRDRGGSSGALEQKRSAGRSERRPA